MGIYNIVTRSQTLSTWNCHVSAGSRPYKVSQAHIHTETASAMNYTCTEFLRSKSGMNSLAVLLSNILAMCNDAVYKIGN
jgi:hypothetical protein